MVKKGTETRDWTYVDDIIDGLLAMGINEEAVEEAINLGSGKEHKVIDMANMVNELTGQTLRNTIVDIEDVKKFMNNAPVLIDVRGMFNGEEAKRKGFYYRRL